MRQIWSEFLVSVNGKMTGKKEKMSLPAKDKEPVEDWAAEPKPTTQTKPKPKPSTKPEPQSVDPERTISFQPDPKEKEEPSKKPSLGRNPLLSQI